MKRPWLAALLNVYSGLGYLYLDIKRPFGWLVAISNTLMIASTFDNSPTYNAWVNSKYTVYDWLGLASFIALTIAFIVDGYFEARRKNKQNPLPKELEKLPKDAYISKVDFVLISVLTLGMYNTYWSWRTWEHIRNSRGEKYPFPSALRSIFLTISNFALLPQLDKLAGEKKIKTRVSGMTIAVLYLVMAFAGEIIYRYAPVSIPGILLVLATSLLSAIILLPMVDLQNKYVVATKGKYMPAKNNWWLIAFISLVGLFSALTIF